MNIRLINILNTGGLFSPKLWLALAFLGACGNPFGNNSDIAKDFHPGAPTVTPTNPANPTEDLNRPHLKASTTSYSSMSAVTQSSSDPNQPVLRQVAILNHDVDRRGTPHTPDAVTLSPDGKAVLPDPSSACGATCHVKKMYLGLLSLFSGDGS